MRRSRAISSPRDANGNPSSPSGDALTGRKGRFWSERYHRHDLRTPTETKNALRYVLLNIKKHARAQTDVAARYSSASSFDGFTRPPRILDDGLFWPRVTPRTWLLATGWRRRGLIDPAESPEPKTSS